MTRASIHEYAQAQRVRSSQASGPEKRRILDAVVAVTGSHRKAAIRLLHRPPRRPPSRPRSGRPRVYGPQVATAAKVFWEATGQIGAERLQPFIPELLDRLSQCGALTLVPETADALRRASPATLKRLLAPARAALPPRGRGLTRAGTWLKPQIPVRPLRGLG